MAQTTRRDAKGETLRESVEHVWLAGLGALALTEEEGSKFFRALVKKGEGVEKRSRTRLDDAMQAAKRAPGRAVANIEKQTDEVMQNVMQRLGVPTRREIEGLAKRIEGLTATIEHKGRTRRLTSGTRTRSKSTDENAASMTS